MMKEKSTSELLSNLQNFFVEPFSTGFPQLDEILDGGLVNRLYVLGGEPSVGKTAFAVQMCDQIAQQGKDVIFITTVESSREIFTRSIHRIKSLAEVVLVEKGKRKDTGLEEKALDMAVNTYKAYAGRIYIRDDVESIEQVYGVVKEFIDATGSTPLVVIDNLQMLQIMAAEDSRTLTLMMLKQLSSQCKCTIFMTSWVSKASYSSTITLKSFSENKEVERVADVLMGLQMEGASKKDFDAMKAKNRNPREVELVLLKNRHGATGGVVKFEYYAPLGYFREQDID